MEKEEEKKKEGSSYRYWVREATADAAPPPLPQKLSNNDVALNTAPASLGSLWNRVCFLLYCFHLLNLLAIFFAFTYSCLVSIGWHLGREKSHQLGH